MPDSEFWTDFKFLKVLKQWVSADHFFFSRFFVVSLCYYELLRWSLEKLSKIHHDPSFIDVYRELHSYRGFLNYNTPDRFWEIPEKSPNKNPRKKTRFMFSDQKPPIFPIKPPKKKVCRWYPVLWWIRPRKEKEDGISFDFFAPPVLFSQVAVWHGV